MNQHINTERLTFIFQIKDVSSENSIRREENHFLSSLFIGAGFSVCNAQHLRI